MWTDDASFMHAPDLEIVCNIVAFSDMPSQFTVLVRHAYTQPSVVCQVLVHLPGELVLIISFKPILVGAFLTDLCCSLMNSASRIVLFRKVAG